MASTDFILRPSERLDDLIRDGMKIIQRPDEFCFSLDSVLLAQFASLKKADRVWDLGTGTGVLALLLTSRGARDITAVELNPVLADIARRNVVGNGREAQIKVREADYRRHRELFPANSADLVICNPPYRALGGGDRSQLTGVAAARHETTATKQDVIAAAAYLLRYGGRFALVQRADRTAEWCAALEAAKLAVKRLQFVHSRQGTPAKLVLLEARMNGRADCTVLPPLFVHDDHGDYTPDILRLYGKEVAD